MTETETEAGVETRQDMTRQGKTRQDGISLGRQTDGSVVIVDERATHMYAHNARACTFAYAHAASQSRHASFAFSFVTRNLMMLWRLIDACACEKSRPRARYHCSKVVGMRAGYCISECLKVCAQHIRSKPPSAKLQRHAEEVLSGDQPQ